MFSLINVLVDFASPEGVLYSSIVCWGKTRLVTFKYGGGFPQQTILIPDFQSRPKSSLVKKWTNQTPAIQTPGPQIAVVYNIFVHLAVDNKRTLKCLRYIR